MCMLFSIFLLNVSFSGPVLALCLAREDAVSEWRKLLGSSEAETQDEEPKKEQEVELR